MACFLAMCLLLFVTTAQADLGSITNNNFGPGDHTNNNEVADGESIVNNNFGDGFQWHEYFNPFYWLSRRPSFYNNNGGQEGIVNNNGGLLGNTENKCPYGSIVNNNGPGNVQVICLPPGQPSMVNNNG